MRVRHRASSSNTLFHWSHRAGGAGPKARTGSRWQRRCEIARPTRWRGPAARFPGPCLGESRIAGDGGPRVRVSRARPAGSSGARVGRRACSLAHLHSAPSGWLLAQARFAGSNFSFRAAREHARRPGSPAQTFCKQRKGGVAGTATRRRRGVIAVARVWDSDESSSPPSPADSRPPPGPPSAGFAGLVGATSRNAPNTEKVGF